MGRETPLKIALSPKGIWAPPTNTWIPGPTQVHVLNSISIGSAILAQLTIVTNRHSEHTDHDTSVTIGYIVSHVIGE